MASHLQNLLCISLLLNGVNTCVGYVLNGFTAQAVLPRTPSAYWSPYLALDEINLCFLFGGRGTVTGGEKPERRRQRYLRNLRDFLDPGEGMYVEYICFVS